MNSAIIEENDLEFAISGDTELFVPVIVDTVPSADQRLILSDIFGDESYRIIHSRDIKGCLDDFSSKLKAKYNLILTFKPVRELLFSPPEGGKKKYPDFRNYPEFMFNRRAIPLQGGNFLVWCPSSGSKIGSTISYLKEAIASGGLQFPGEAFNELEGYELAPTTPAFIQQLLWDIERVAKENENIVSVDVETTSLSPHNGTILTIGFAWKSKDKIHSTAIPLANTYYTNSDDLGNVKESVKGFFNSGLKFVFHNATFDVGFLCYNELLTDPKTIIYDTAVIPKMIDSRFSMTSLDSWARYLLGIPSYKDKYSIDRSRMEDVNLFEILRYNAADAATTLELFSRLWNKADSQARMASLMECGKLFALAKTMLHGLRLDQKYIAEAKEKTDTDFNNLYSKIQSQTGTSINPLSPAQVSKYLRSSGIIVPDTSFDTMSKMDIPVMKDILDLRTLNIRKAALEKYASYGDRVYSQFNFLQTLSGRLSSREPNLQNIEKSEMRRMVIPEDEHILVDIDFGQLEACVIASVSKDEYFTNAIINGLDVHMDVAKELNSRYPDYFKVIDGDWKDLRNRVKSNFVFAAFYKASIKTLAGKFNAPEDIIKKFMDEWFWPKFAGVASWHNKLVKSYRKDGYVTGPTGRVYRGNMTLNMVVNLPIQGSASDIVCQAYTRCTHKGYIPISTVHDEFLFSIPEDNHEKTIKEIIDIVLEKPSFKVKKKDLFSWLITPLAITVKKGYNWWDTEEVGKFNSTWGKP